MNCTQELHCGYKKEKKKNVWNKKVNIAQSAAPILTLSSIMSPKTLYEYSLAESGTNRFIYLLVRKQISPFLKSIPKLKRTGHIF